MGIQFLAVVAQRFPRIVIMLWAVLLLLIGMHASKLPAVLEDHGLLADGDYSEVQRILAVDYQIPDDPVILLFEREAQLSTAEFHGFIALTLQRLEGVRGIEAIRSPLEHPGMFKGNYAYALLASSYKSYEITPLLNEAAARLPAHEFASVTMTGKSVIQRDVNETSERDLRQAEMIGLPIAFLILLFAFRGIVPAILPVVIGMVAVSITMGLMYGLGTIVSLSNFVLNVIPMVGLALSIDFALLIVGRYREELACSAAEQALATAMGTAGRAVLLSAACAGFGLAGICLIPLPLFRSVALGAAAVLAVSVLLALTLLPALLTLLTPCLRSASNPRSQLQTSNLWPLWAAFVMRRPVVLSILASLLLIILFMPLTKLKIAIPDASSLPQQYASRSAYQTFEFHFGLPGASQIYMLANVSGAEWSGLGEKEREVHSVMQRLTGDPFVAEVNAVPSPVVPRLREQQGSSTRPQDIGEQRMLLHAILKDSASSEAARSWVRELAREVQAGKVQWLIGGEPKYQQEVFDAIFNNIKYAGMFIFAANFMLLAIAFHSIVIPIKTIVMNMLSLGASFGILAWIFEEGIGGFERSPVAIMIPVFIFGLVFGISMDYGVFLLSRIYEAHRKTGDNEYAVMAGLSSTSRIITSAAAILIAVTAPFALGEVAGVKQLGIGIAAAILIDATIIRLVLVPSFMKWLGRWNWWVPWERTK
ncbi:MMPL family transporter [Paenibacillus oenotherae]|uniref:MMPL family transporter n=1 Tax=Paenibacillus oenotherae TaxID=1435645 RepID=A0ABS7DAX3_9BACL|nr:MMPL family transporter [Paenibacillus oenotherae]MBW7477093.1 MMPL family transporter [Paenibacillus oenotherae]